MARSRNIKPGFFKNEDLIELEPLVRLLFIGLWTIADREGRLEDRPKRIKLEVLPVDNCDVDDMLSQLHTAGFIERYSIEGKRYIQIINWHKHQNPHLKEKESIIPAPCKNHASTVQEPCENGTSPADSLIPDSLNLIPDSKHMSPNGSTETADGAQSMTGKGQKTPAEKSDGYSPKFELFWQHYPNKKEKKAAFEKWKARIRDGVDAKTLISCAVNYRDFCLINGTELRFVKLAKTFLGPNKPYEDYLQPVKESVNGPPKQPSLSPAKTEILEKLRKAGLT